MTLYRNVADQEVFFTLVNAGTGAPVAGAVVTAWLTRNGGAQAAGAGSVDDLGNGQYRYNFAQAETNGESVGLLLLAAGCVPVSFTWTTALARLAPSVGGAVGAGLVSVDRVRQHLKLPATMGEDLDLTLKVTQASEIILAFIARSNDATWTAEIASWTTATVPAIVQAAILRQAANLYIHRGDELGVELQGICPDAAALLLATGYRDPVVA